MAGRGGVESPFLGSRELQLNPVRLYRVSSLRTNRGGRHYVSLWAVSFNGLLGPITKAPNGAGEGGGGGEVVRGRGGNWGKRGLSKRSAGIGERWNEASFSGVRCCFCRGNNFTPS